MNSRPPERLRLDRQATPIGEALIVTDEAGCLRAFDWADREADMARLLRLHYGSLVPTASAAPADIKRLVRRYFEGEPGCLRAIEWRTGGTTFQRSVWTALTRIAPGETLSYGALAAKLGCPQSVRAKDPLSLSRRADSSPPAWRIQSHSRKSLMPRALGCAGVCRRA